MRDSSLIVLLLSAGCPYIWTEPEFSDARPVPDDADADADADADTDVDADSAETGDTGSIVEVVPKLVSATAHMRLDAVELRFEIVDGDDDLDGGQITLTQDGGEPLTYQIPGELALIDGAGVITLEPIPRECGGSPLQHSYGLSVTDLAGHTSEVADLTLTIERISVDEPSSEPAKLDLVQAPAILCGTLATKIDKADQWRFDHQPGGLWSFSLEYDPDDPDIDLLLEEVSGPVITYTKGELQPKTLSAKLKGGTDYELQISRSCEGEAQDYTPCEGEAQNYTITIHEP
ncbi:MAG TPA: hypothetical protein ENK18_26170 [Deltaproteobacteria bacterium]|nr:hypothetical protein [Deltaproteobacteria bacterium]